LHSDKRVKIARVIVPLTLESTAFAKAKKLLPLEEWYSKHWDRITFTKYGTQWISQWKVYTHPDGFLWLFFGLPFKLIKGRYSLFMADARDPQGIVTFLISKILRKPIILSDTFMKWSESLLAKLYWPFSRLAASHATVLTVNSQRVKSFWEETGVQSDNIKVSVLWFVSLIENDEKKTCLAEKVKSELGYPKIILFVGRLIPRKGVDYLIKAFEKVSNDVNGAGLLIVGEGPDRDRLEKLRDNIGTNNVIFTGYVDDDTRALYYLLADIFVLPSIDLKVTEEWGLVVNEAMSVGKPAIVTTAVGCAYELVKNGVNGYVVQEKNVEALYQAIKRLLNDDELRIKMGREAKKTINDSYNNEKAINDCIETIYKALMISLKPKIR
jgi:glycosyltransferase involved in cell wall biosynthesis